MFAQTHRCHDLRKHSNNGNCDDKLNGSETIYVRSHEVAVQVYYIAHSLEAPFPSCYFWSQSDLSSVFAPLSLNPKP